MNITTSLIFIPKNAIYVKKSLGLDILGNLTPQSPLLRDVNSKKKKNENQTSETILKKEKTNYIGKQGEKKYIINKTGSPIITSFPERDNSGNPIIIKDRNGNSIEKTIMIKNLIEKSKFSENNLESQEMKNLYENNFIIDGTEEDISKIKSSEKAELKKIANKNYKSLNKEKKVVESNEKQITITEDLHSNERSIIEDDDDIPEPRTGLSEMFTEAENDENGSIDDLIPAGRTTSSGNKGSVKRI